MQDTARTTRARARGSLAVALLVVLAALAIPSAASASAYGIQYWGAFTISVKGQSIGIPSGQLAHRINGSGTHIDSEWSHITTAGLCNWRVDYVYRDAENGREYRRIRTATHYSCDSWAYAPTVYPGNVRRGSACAELHRDGVFVTRQCHSIH